MVTARVINVMMTVWLTLKNWRHCKTK